MATFGPGRGGNGGSGGNGGGGDDNNPRGRVGLYGKWGNPRQVAREAARSERARMQAELMASRQAAASGRGRAVDDRDPTPHGMTPEHIEMMRDRFEHWLPKLAGSAQPYTRAQRFFDGLLPPGASLDPGAGDGLRGAMAKQRALRNGRTAQMWSGSGLPMGATLPGQPGSFSTMQRPFLPEFESPDRQSYPIHRCISEGELVALASGRVAPIESVEVGDKLLGPDGQPRTVEAVWSEGTPEELLEIEWANGRKVQCTKEHVWPTKRGDYPASELAIGDLCFLVGQAENDLAVRAICAVDNRDTKKRVYDLTVSGDHKYCLAGGLVTHNSLANIYWRLYYKLDPIIGMGVDLLAEMLWSNFQLTGEGIAGEIKDALEEMVELTQLRPMLTAMVREFLVIGEAVPHLHFSDDLGIWTHIALHNPDQLEVIHSPFLDMEPLVEFRPDDRLRQILTSSHPMLRHVRETMPEEILAALTSGQNIPLSPINCTFLARKLHPYDIRGTSIQSRLWRLLLYEDALFSASFAIARRAAGPLKIAKLGDRTTGYMPDPAQEQKFLELLTAAETDPAAWICFPAGTPVVMADGTQKPIEQVVVGDEVLDEAGLPQKVERAWCEGTPATVTEIDLVGGISLRATHKHRWPTWAWPRECACGCGTKIKPGRPFASGHNRRGNVELLPAFKHDMEVLASGKATFAKRIPADWQPFCDLESEQLHEGDYLLSPRGFRQRIPDGVTEIHAKLLGYYVAEGHTAQGRMDYGRLPDGETRIVVWSFGDHEEHTLAADTVRLCAELGITAHVYVQASSARVYITHSRDAHLAKWLESNGGNGATTKRLSRAVMEWPLNLKRALLEGMFRGDGCQSLSYGKSKSENGAPQLFVQYSTSSPHLATQTRLLLAQLGVGGAIRHDVPKTCFYQHPLLTVPTPGHPGVCTEGHTTAYKYYIQMTGADARRMADMFWREESLAAEGTPKLRIHRPTYQPTETHLFHEITAVREVTNTLPVFNLSVSGSHTYQVDGVSTHNCYNYAVELELVGSQERAWKIEQTAEFIERNKLMALGLSKSFVVGETSFASAASGLTVFLQRAKSLREYFESQWLYPKYFRPVAEMNQWVKPTEAELSHRVRTKRSKAELRESKRYILPKVEWDRPLDPSVDSAMIQAVSSLSQLGVRFSKQTLMSFVNRDHEDELQQIIRETEAEQKLLSRHPELSQALGQGGQEGGGGGGMLGGPGPGGLSPGLPPGGDELPSETGLMPGPGPGGEIPAPGGEAPPPGGPPPAAAAADGTEGHGGTATPEALYDEHGQYGAWSKGEVEDLRGLLSGDSPEDEPWTRMLAEWTDAAGGRDPNLKAEAREALHALRDEDVPEAWLHIEHWLFARSYPPKTIRQLQELLVGHGVLPQPVNVARAASGRQITALIPKPIREHRVPPTAGSRRTNTAELLVDEPEGPDYFAGAGNMSRGRHRK